MNSIIPDFAFYPTYSIVYGDYNDYHAKANKITINF